jgi:hypothetical protein
MEGAEGEREFDPGVAKGSCELVNQCVGECRAASGWFGRLGKAYNNMRSAACVEINGDAPSGQADGGGGIGTHDGRIGGQG